MTNLVVVAIVKSSQVGLKTVSLKILLNLNIELKFIKRVGFIAASRRDYLIKF
jgi:hypothetical protein